MTEHVSLEVCVDSVQSACTAEAAGALRVELCDNLFDGGTTPSAGMISLVRQNIKIGLQVLIRPRGGDFYYTEDEFNVMQEDIRYAQALGADGVVLGLLTPSGCVDIERTKRLVALARPLKVTFHRAFDLAKDPFQALEDVISTGADCLLTSGQAETAYAGRQLIAELQQRAKGRIVVMPGGGITAANVADLIKTTKVSIFHASGRKTVESSMLYRKPNLRMGGGARQSEYINRVADGILLKTMLAKAQQHLGS